MSTVTSEPVVLGEWSRRSACLGQDPEIFFDDADPAARTRAVEICTSCPVREECLQWALDSNQADGIWGGLTPRQRRRLLAERAAQTVDAESTGVGSRRISRRPWYHAEITQAVSRRRRDGQATCDAVAARHGVPL